MSLSHTALNGKRSPQGAGVLAPFFFNAHYEAFFLLSKAKGTTPFTIATTALHLQPHIELVLNRGGNMSAFCLCSV